MLVMLLFANDVLFLEDSVGDGFVASTKDTAYQKMFVEYLYSRGTVYLDWEPWNVPARYPSDILHNNLKVGELYHCDCVECYIEQNERPFEEGVYGVRWECQ